MWDVPRYRIRAYVRALKRTREERRKQQGPKLHLKRTRAQVRIIEGFASTTASVRSRLVLNELAPTGTYVFTPIPFTEGQLVEVTIHEPRMFYVRGRVVSCEKVNERSVIIAQYPLPYRVRVVWEFQSHYERDMVRIFCGQLAATELWTTPGNTGTA
jgi:hypothetical protein